MTAAAVNPASVAMHVPDGFFTAPMAAAAAVIAVVGLAVCIWGARRELDERTAPLAGLIAAFIFAAQMINFPVGAGTSGHLLGGALAAILVGPFTGALCVSVVLIVQALLFADGGVTALGINIILMSFVTVAVSYGLFRLLLKILPRSRGSIVASSFVAALASVPMSAITFVILYAIGGASSIPVMTVFWAMVSVHVLIGLGEAVITAAAVGAVIGIRPDLVYGARGYLPQVALAPRTPTPTAA